MKLTKLFMGAVLAIAAMAFVACEPDKPVDEPVKEYALEVKSETTMEFPAEGGEGVIEWALNEVTRTSLVPEALPTFYTEAAWITLDADNLGAFAVAVNEGEAREAVINIEYKEQKFAVTVKQAAATSAPVEATELAVAARIPSEELGLENNVFVLAFADDAESLELGVVLVGEEGTEVLAAGAYNVDNEGLVAEECALQIYTEEGLEEYFFESGEVVVAVDGENYDFDITLATTEGEVMRFTYEGVVSGMVPETKPAEPVAFTPAAVKAELYESGNFFLQLYIDGTRYHELDMYDVVAPNEDYLSAGVYSFADETIGSWSTFYRGNDQTCGLVEAEITLVHNTDNTTTITGFIKSEEGDHITIDWTDVIEGMNLAGGEEPGGDEPALVEFTSVAVAAADSNLNYHNLTFTDGTYTAIIKLCTRGTTEYSAGLYDQNGSFGDATTLYIGGYTTDNTWNGAECWPVTMEVIDNGDGTATFNLDYAEYPSAVEHHGTYTGVLEGLTLVEREEPEQPGGVITYEIISATIGYDQAGEKEVQFWYSATNAHVIDFKGMDNCTPGKPLAAGYYSSAEGTIDEGYSIFDYGTTNGTMSSVECTVTDNGGGSRTYDAKFVYNGQEYAFVYTSPAEQVEESGNIVELTSKSAGEKIGSYYYGWTLADAEGNNSVKLVVDEYYAVDKTADFPKANEYTAFQSSVYNILNGAHFSFVNDSLKVNGVTYANDAVSNAKLTVVQATSITIEFTVDGEDYKFVYNAF